MMKQCCGTGGGKEQAPNVIGLRYKERSNFHVTAYRDIAFYLQSNCEILPKPPKKYKYVGVLEILASY